MEIGKKDVIMCPKCKILPATELHLCTYSEVYGNPDPKDCTCCGRCQRICGLVILDKS